jgi:sec-independent protein translocase protein TatA
MPFLLFQGIGAPELLIIFAIIVVLFGASRLADVGGALGRAIREFRREIREASKEEEKPRLKEGVRPQMPGREGGQEERRGPFQH